MNKCPLCGSTNIEKVEIFEPRVTSIYCNDCKTSSNKVHLVKTKLFLEYYRSICAFLCLFMVAFSFIIDSLKWYHAGYVAASYLVIVISLVIFHFFRKEQ